jgi:hypothetical protein
MARDNKQVFRFVQTAQANGSNQLLVQNYAASASVLSSGASFSFSAAATASSWSQGVSQTLNRAGFRTTNADQSIVVSGETSATLNDPALWGNLNGAERYCHVVISPYGAILGTTRFEIFVEGASDSGTGTAGTDWSAISTSVPLPINATYTAPSALVISSGIGTLASHGFQVGDILVTRAAATNLAIAQPIYVVSVTNTSTFTVSKTPYGPIDTTISASSSVFDKCVSRRLLAIPMGPNPKPWIRLVVRALPNSSVTPSTNTGVVIDSAYLTMGRDCAALI